MNEFLENLAALGLPPFERTALFSDTRKPLALLLEAAPVAPLCFNTKNWLKSPVSKAGGKTPFWSRDYTGVSLSSSTFSSASDRSCKNARTAESVVSPIARRYAALAFFTRPACANTCARVAQ